MPIINKKAIGWILCYLKGICKNWEIYIIN